jgi:hypothetical protein
MMILAIDPGDQKSAYCLIDAETRRPSAYGIAPNNELLELLRDDGWNPDRVAIEMIASYGMSVGANVFETCVWIGRFAQAIADHVLVEPQLIKRLPVKMHHCHSAKAKDTNIRQALIDRFAPGARNGGKGTKAEPGWFYGFADDIWAAYAIAVYVADAERTVLDA